MYQADDDACCAGENCHEKGIRRYYAAACAQKQGLAGEGEVLCLQMLMNRLGVLEARGSPLRGRGAAPRKNRPVRPPPAMELADGTLVTGKTTDLPGASAAMLLNALKTLAGIDDAVLLISPRVIEPIQELKVGVLGNRNPRLHTDEILLALSICAADDELAARAMQMLPRLSDCQAHSSVILSKVDEVDTPPSSACRSPYEPRYETATLYHN